MKQRKTVLGLLAAGALAGALAGCSADGANSGGNTSAQAAAPEGATLVSCSSGQCSGVFQLEAATWGGACVNGDVIVAKPEGRELFQFTGVLTVADGAPDYYGDGPSAGLGILEANGGELELETGCLKPEPYQDWQTPANAGEKVRLYGAAFAPEGTTEITLDELTFNVADLPKAEGELLLISAPVIGYEGLTPQTPRELDLVIVSCGEWWETPGLTRFADYVVGWTEICEAKMNEQYGGAQ